MDDPAIFVHIARNGAEYGRYYLSYVELLLRERSLSADDWGWVEGESEWHTLETLVPMLRARTGKKRKITGNQRKFLRGLGFEPWRGMSNREASAVIEVGGNLDGWPFKLKPTRKQMAYLKHLGVSDPPPSKDDACALIQRLHEDTSLDQKTKEYIAQQRATWIAERSIKYPELYPPVIVRNEQILNDEIQRTEVGLKNASDEDEREFMAECLEDLKAELKDWKKEQRENARDEARMAKEDARERIAGLQWEMGSEGHWTDSIKRPTLTQVKECVEELDRENPQWEDELATPLFERLLKQYPTLRRS